MVKVSRVSPSGDMARKAFYDRNALDQTQYVWTGPLAQHGWTERFSYTVPSGRKVMLTCATLIINGPPVTAGSSCMSRLFVQAGTKQFLTTYKDSTSGIWVLETAIFQHPFGEETIKGQTFSSDLSANHAFGLFCGLVEFDA